MYKAISFGVCEEFSEDSEEDEESVLSLDVNTSTECVIHRLNEYLQKEIKGIDVSSILSSKEFIDKIKHVISLGQYDDVDDHSIDIDTSMEGVVKILKEYLV